MSSRASWTRILDVAAAISMIVTAAILVYATFRQPAAAAKSPSAGKEIPLPKEPVSLDLSQLRGQRSARVVMVEFSDFECPFCKKFATETWPTLDKDYVETGKVLFAFRHLPIESIHKTAMPAARAAECAGDQSKFWEYSSLLFARPGALTESDLAEAAGETGLDKPKFQTCVAESASRVKASMDGAIALGINTTPAFFVGTPTSDGRVRVADVIRGAQPLTTFRSALDKVLAMAK